MSWNPESPLSSSWSEELGNNTTSVVDIAVVDEAVVDGDDGWTSETPTSGGFD